DSEPEDVGAEIEQGPGQDGHEHAELNAGQHAEQPASRDVVILALGADLLEIGVDDAQDERGLEAFSKRDDEGAAHEASRLRGADGPGRLLVEGGQEGGWPGPWRAVL